MSTGEMEGVNAANHEAGGRCDRRDCATMAAGTVDDRPPPAPGTTIATMSLRMLSTPSEVTLEIFTARKEVNKLFLIDLVYIIS